ncbi:hypothetical protein K6Y79_22905 [Burkholderia cenocepacia]|nr:hypothetical protein [Burkholderia cenocepacia]MCW3513406.1 hypothetical protein [Burkholderia cenocepacia]MCW3518063.1 hypothetical protein [Burkholderia cenocepacia]MCW3533462.1 hypothetical protein [Burkholderia cenocepacia]MCW3548671.1 hypothetical protein [Burkholderia cenocepacia]
MKRRMLMAVVLLALGACAGSQRAATFRSTETQLLEGRQAASLRCSTRTECDGAWNRTQRYIESHSATRVIRSGMDRIETAQPYVAGEVYLWASRTVSDGGGYVIRLKPMCKGMYDSDGGPGWQYDTCAKKILGIQSGFLSYVRQPPSPHIPSLPSER